MLLSKNREALVSIYLSNAQLSDNNSTALYAAKELRYYLDRMTSASFQIEENTAPVPGIYLGDITGIDTSELGEDGAVREYTFDPKRFFGMTRPLASISGGTPEMNAAITRKIQCVFHSVTPAIP